MHVLRSVVAICVLAVTTGELASSEQAGRGDASIRHRDPPVQTRGVAGAADQCGWSARRLEFHPGVVGRRHGARHDPGAPSRRAPDPGVRRQRERFSARGATGCSARERSRPFPRAHWTEDKSHYSAVYGPAGCTACGAHSIRVDPQGNIWAIDAPGHVVYKLNPEGKEIMRLGTKGSAGTGRNTFNLPTDVAFAPNGDLYVSDGYGSARVVKFSRDGKYILEWGTRGKGPRRVRAAPQRRGRRAGQGLRHRSRQPADRGVRCEREVPESMDGHRRVSGLFMTKDQRIWTGGVLRDLDGKARGTTVRTGDRWSAWRGGDRVGRCLPRATQRHRSEIRQAVISPPGGP